MIDDYANKSHSCNLGTNGNLIVRKVAVTDINECYLNTLNDMSYLQYTVCPSNRQSICDIERYVTEQEKSDTSLFLGLFLEEYLVATTRIHMQDSKTWQGLLVFNSHHGKGYGAKLLIMSTDYLFNNNICEEIYAGILTENVASKRVFEKAGFYLYSYDPNWSDREIWVKKKSHT